MREIDKSYASQAERPGIGHLLEHARQRQGVSLEQAERATLIRKDYLQRLENDDHSAMPEPIYVRGFVKAYADFLGLEGDRFSSGRHPGYLRDTSFAGQDPCFRRLALGT
jgi:hypothetical protein